MIAIRHLPILRIPVLFLLFCLGSLLTAHAPAQAADGSAESNRRFIEKAFEDWAAGGRTFFEDVLAPDATWIIKGTSPVAGTYRGRDDFLERAVKPFAARMATPVRPTVRDIWAADNDVVVHWDGTGTAGDGKAYRNSYVWIFRMDGQKAKEVIAFLDLVPYDDVIQRVPAPKAGK